MSQIKIQGGTAVGNKSLCTSCKYAQEMKGFKLNEQETYCWLLIHTATAFNATRVPFPIAECNGYIPKDQMSKEAMEKIALEVKAHKPVGGFKNGIS